MISKKMNWYSSPSLLLLAAGCLFAIGPSLVSCSSDCEDRDDCAPYAPPGGTSSSGSSGDAGAPDHGGTAGAAPNGGGSTGGGPEGGAGGVTGGSGEGGSTAPEPCDGACRAPTPICDKSTETCVECLKEGDCTGSESKCDTASRECVECLSSEHCSSPAAAKCDAGACVQCEVDDDCAHLDGTSICDSGTCVQCTVADETACNGKSCNPATQACTATDVGSRDICEPCVADSECIDGNKADPDVRCIAMEYNGVPREGGFCLRRGAKTCERPFKVPIDAPSLSGAPIEAYCGINEANTRCEAVLDLQRSRSCSASMDTQCGCTRDLDNNCVEVGESGLCRTVGLDPNRCTYRCGANDHCPDGFTCSNTSPKYCR